LYGKKEALGASPHVGMMSRGKLKIFPIRRKKVLDVAYFLYYMSMYRETESDPRKRKDTIKDTKKWLIALELG
jgi:hypothetical protein